MSMGWIGLGSAVIGAVGSANAANAQSKANANQIAWEQEQYQNAQDHFAGRGSAYDDAVATLGGSFGTSSGCSGAALAQAYDAKSYDMKAFMSEAYKVELDGFLEAFKDAETVNNWSMDKFSRRYGSIMDNVKQNILDVSQKRLAASGREQLALDAKTLGQNFDQEMVKKGMARSGMSVEMEGRMQMEVNKQARAIDVNSYDQANQLQAQGVQALNSMTGIEQQIMQRGEQMHQNKAQGLLQAGMQDASMLTNVSMQNAANRQDASKTNAVNRTNVSMNNANNRTNVSITNATNATNKSIAAAKNATSKALGLARIQADRASAADSFYAGNPGAGVSNAYGNQATAAGQDAAGWGKVAGWGMEKAFDAWAPTKAATPKVG